MIVLVCSACLHNIISKLVKDPCILVSSVCFCVLFSVIIEVSIPHLVAWAYVIFGFLFQFSSLLKGFHSLVSVYLCNESSLSVEVKQILFVWFLDTFHSLGSFPDAVSQACDLPHFTHLGLCAQYPGVWKDSWHCGVCILFWSGVSIWNLVFCRNSKCYLSLLLAAVRYVRRRATPCPMFQRFIICVPCFQFLLSPIPAAINGVDFWLPFCKRVVAEFGTCGSQRLSLLICLLLFCFNPVFILFLFSLICYLPLQLQPLVCYSRVKHH